MNMHEKILDNLQELVYIADMETYELLYYNRALAEEFHIPQRLHGKCYEILQGRRDPCPFCTNGKLSQDGCYVWKFYNQLVGHHFLLSDSICEFNGRQVRTEIASDITEHVLLQEQLDKNLSLQNFINHCARKLIADAAQAGDGPDKVRTADSGHGRTGHAVMLHGDGAAGSDDDDF